MPDTVLVLVIKEYIRKTKSLLMELTIYWNETFIYVLFHMSNGVKYCNEKIKQIKRRNVLAIAC